MDCPGVNYKNSCDFDMKIEYVSMHSTYRNFGQLVNQRPYTVLLIYIYIYIIIRYKPLCVRKRVVDVYGMHNNFSYAVYRDTLHTTPYVIPSDQILMYNINVLPSAIYYVTYRIDIGMS